MIVGIGDNCIDRYLSPVEADFVGGNVINVVANIVLRGGRAAYVGSVGDDPEGERVAEALWGVGVDTRWLRRVHGPTGLTEIEVCDGDYRVVSERYGVSDTVDLAADALDAIAADATWVHTSLTGHGERYAGELRRRGLGVSSDLGIIRTPEALDAVRPWLSRFDLLFFSAGADLDDRAVADLAREIQRDGPETVVATRSAKGCLAVSGAASVALGAVDDPSPVVDPLGAGDAFIAGFLAASDGLLEARLQQGSRWAAEACRRFGAWPQGEQPALPANAARAARCVGG